MTRLNQKITVAIMTATLVNIASCTNDIQDGNIEIAEAKSQGDYNSDAINNPDKFAWDVFLEISKPADPNNPEGETMWQKEWANAKDVFADSSKAADWNKIVGLPLLRDINKGLPIQQEIFNEMLLKMGLTEMEIESLHQTSICQAVDSMILNETKMNKPTFDFIVNNNMYYAEGVEAMFLSKTKIDAPTESREIKALWKPIDSSEKSKYHFVEKDGKIYGLVSLHIITKDLPNWFWATFEHKDNECLSEAEKNPLLKSVDTYGKNPDGTISKELKGDLIKNGMSDKWHNYVLRGSQIDFTSSTGENLILANTYTENGFVTTSSCITCHARATVGPYDGDGNMNHLSIFESRKPTYVGHIGSPNSNWFYQYNPDGTKDVKYLQTDFMWSIPFRAKRRSK